MKIAFLHSDKVRERLLAEAFAVGARRHGDLVDLRPLKPEVEVMSDCEVAVMVGVKSRERWKANWAAGVHTVMLDKGYCRGKGAGPVGGWEYWRIAVDGHHPTRYLMREPKPSDRWDALGIEAAPWRKAGRHILLAGSSQKYHDFYGLRDPTSYVGKIVKQLNELSKREIVYRPKPSWRDAVEVHGTRFSRPPETINDVLIDCHVMITHGSNAVFEALLAGVPAIVLGDAISKPISSTQLAEVESPRLAGKGERRHLLSNLAYCQWKLSEFASGEAWAVTRPLVFG